MKRLLLYSGLCFITLNLYAQDPILTKNNWYIEYLEIGGTVHPSPISGGIGIIDPNLVFENNQAYAVVDPFSDSFFSDVDHHPSDPVFTFFNMGITLPGCQAHCEFAATYFDLLVGDFIENTFEYNVVDNTDGSKTLTITDTNGDFAVFNDFPPLGLEDFALNKIQIYPNPVSDELFVSSEIFIHEIMVIDLTGREVLKQISNSFFIDVSSLSEGIYVLKVTSDFGRSFKRFIKK
ncbi:MAG: T9SS type A sorting domain-containing protein [Flavobacteriaceae bacterium]|nr:T9SS type A sorting domain-containing protein [Flavobacteriaceae bacterium]